VITRTFLITEHRRASSQVDHRDHGPFMIRESPGVAIAAPAARPITVIMVLS
jgi:hypothetical protein